MGTPRLQALSILTGGVKIRLKQCFFLRSTWALPSMRVILMLERKISLLLQFLKLLNDKQVIQNSCVPRYSDLRAVSGPKVPV